jgi:hypothetical protein
MQYATFLLMSLSAREVLGVNQQSLILSKLFYGCAWRVKKFDFCNKQNFFPEAQLCCCWESSAHDQMISQKNKFSTDEKFAQSFRTFPHSSAHFRTFPHDSAQSLVAGFCVDSVSEPRHQSPTPLHIKPRRSSPAPAAQTSRPTAIAARCQQQQHNERNMNLTQEELSLLHRGLRWIGFDRCGQKHKIAPPQIQVHVHRASSCIKQAL